MRTIKRYYKIGAIVILMIALLFISTNPSPGEFKTEVVDGIIVPGFYRGNKFYEIRTKRTNNYWFYSIYKVTFIRRDQVLAEYQYLAFLSNFKRK